MSWPATRVAAVPLVALLACSLTACSPLDEIPVPQTSSEGPWACDGVARFNIERIVGNPNLPMQTGDWRTVKEHGFACNVDSPHGTVDITVTPFTAEEAPTKAAELTESWLASGGEPIADPKGAPGQGYIFGEPGVQVTAGWVCTDRSLEVVLTDVFPDERRDQFDDAENMLLGVLGYACAMEQVPDLDYSAK